MPTIADKRRFQIGDWVTWTHRCVFVTDRGKRTMERGPNCAIDRDVGQIVGLALRMEGHLEGNGSVGASYDGESYGFESTYLAVTESHCLWRVRTGMFNREILVRDEDTMLVQLFPREKLPLRDSGKIPEKDRERLAQIMRDEMKNRSRDAKGRWLSVEKV